MVLVDADLFDPSDPEFQDVVADTESEHFVIAGLKRLGHEVSVLPLRPSRRHLPAIARDLERLRPDIVFNFIEYLDGDRRHAAAVPTLLERLRIPYTGASASGMASIDKASSKRAVSTIGFPVPSFVVVPLGMTRAPRCPFAFPAIVKSQFGGASVGLTLGSLIRAKHEMMPRARDIHRRLNEPAICEQYIDGPELSVGLIEDRDEILVLPIRETIFGLADHGGPRFCTERVKDSSKYRDRWGIHYRRAQLPQRLDRRIQTLCRGAFRILRLSGYARIDVRLNAADDPVFLEANANPDLAPRYFGIMASWMGLTYEDVLLKLLHAGLNRPRHQQSDSAR